MKSPFLLSKIAMQSLVGVCPVEKECASFSAPLNHLFLGLLSLLEGFSQVIPNACREKERALGVIEESWPEVLRGLFCIDLLHQN